MNRSLTSTTAVYQQLRRQVITRTQTQNSRCDRDLLTNPCSLLIQQRRQQFWSKQHSTSLYNSSFRYITSFNKFTTKSSTIIPYCCQSSQVIFCYRNVPISTNNESPILLQRRQNQQQQLHIQEKETLLYHIRSFHTSNPLHKDDTTSTTSTSTSSDDITTTITGTAIASEAEATTTPIATTDNTNNTDSKDATTAETSSSTTSKIEELQPSSNSSNDTVTLPATDTTAQKEVPTPQSSTEKEPTLSSETETAKSNNKPKKDKGSKSTTTSTDAVPAEPPAPPGTGGFRTVDIEAIKPKLEGGPVIDANGVRQYSTPELTKDAKHHRMGLDDPTCPQYQNPLYHNNPDLDTKFYREDFQSDEEFEAAVQPAPPLDNIDGTPTYPQHLHDLADDMLHLTMLEMNELINRMADHYGFHEGIMSPEGSGDGGDDADDGDDGGGEAAKVVEEKTHFDVKLVSFDAAIKIKLIKEVRVIVPGLGLKEAKELVEGAPCTLQKGVNKEVADQTKEKLVALGAVIEIV